MTMPREHDSVDRALAAQRCESLTPPTFNPELDEYLMREFDSRRTVRASRRPLVACAAVVLIAGVAFAAAGGVSKLRTWMVHIEMGDQGARILVPEGGSGSMIIENDDGGRTTIDVSKASADDGGDTTRVQIVRRGESSEEESVAEIVRQRGFADEEDIAGYTLDDLGDAEPVYRWDSGGTGYEVYFVPAAEGDLVQVFLVATDPAGNAAVQRLAEVPADRLGDEPQISVDDQGVLTIKNDDGNGSVQ